MGLDSLAVELSDTKCREADIPIRTVIILAPTAYRGASREYGTVSALSGFVTLAPCSPARTLLSMLSASTLLACWFWVCSLHTSPCKESTLCRSDASGSDGLLALN